MTPLSKYESKIIGNWIRNESGSFVKDENCKRIEWLIENKLAKITSNRQFGDWEILYRDPADNRLWEKTYLQSEMHGGGPPSLFLISEEDAHQKYDF